MKPLLVDIGYTKSFDEFLNEIERRQLQHKLMCEYLMRFISSNFLSLFSRETSK